MVSDDGTRLSKEMELHFVWKVIGVFCININEWLPKTITTIPPDPAQHDLLMKMDFIDCVQVF